MTREEFESKIIELGFSIKGKYPNSFIFSNIGEKLPFRVRPDCVEFNLYSEDTGGNIGCLIVGFDKIKVDIEDNALTISDINGGDNPHFFMQFYNFSRENANI